MLDLNEEPGKRENNLTGLISGKMFSNSNEDNATTLAFLTITTRYFSLK